MFAESASGPPFQERTEGFDMETLKNIFQRTVEHIEGKDAFLLDEFNAADWDSVLEDADLVPVKYTRFWMDYQRRYMEGRQKDIIEYCLILRYNGRPAAVWPVSVLLSEGGNRLGHLNDRIAPPLTIKGLSTREKRMLYERCWDILDVISSGFGVEKAEFAHDYYGPDARVSEFQRYLCEKGAETHVLHGLAVDLSLSREELSRSVRKSYRSLINEGRRIFDYRSYDADGFGDDVFREVRELHLRMAGRETRSRDSWREQENWVRGSNAMLNSVRKDGQLAGASLFPFTRDMAVYQIGVYDRELFDIPVAHVLIAEAVDYFKEKGLKTLFLGLRHYEGDLCLKAGPKERNISYFKEGFATGMSLHFYQTVATRRASR